MDAGQPNFAVYVDKMCVATKVFNCWIKKPQNSCPIAGERGSAKRNVGIKHKERWLYLEKIIRPGDVNELTFSFMVLCRWPRLPSAIRNLEKRRLSSVVQLLNVAKGPGVGDRYENLHSVGNLENVSV